jgi:cytochrome c oxidase assembly protein subunit 15
VPARRRLSVSPRGYRRITLVSLILLSFIIVTGASVRLSGSGLGCSDWPTCEEDSLVAELDNVHAMVEFVNRVITGFVSIAVIAAVLGSMWRTPRRRDLTWWSWGLVAGVIAQILLGALVVQERLPPTLVMGHFLLSMVLVWNAMVLHHRAGLPDDEVVVPRELPSITRHVRVLSLLASVVLVSGTFVTGSGPHSGSESEQTKAALEAKGYDITLLTPEELEIERLPFDVPDVARVHGLAVMTFLAATIWLAVRLKRERAPQDVFDAAQALIVIIVAQAGVGYVQYFTGVPELLVGVHILGATLVWIAAVRLHMGVRLPLPRSQGTDPAAPDGRMEAVDGTTNDGDGDPGDRPSDLVTSG